MPRAMSSPSEPVGITGTTTAGESLPEPHDGTFAELPFDLTYRDVDRFVAIKTCGHEKLLVKMVTNKKVWVKNITKIVG